MTRYHGITDDTSKHLIIDSGEVYTGFAGFASLGTLLGSTRGGSQFTLEQEIKEIEVDGARGKMKKFRRITRVNASLTVNFLEHTLTNLKRMLVGSTSAAFETTWDKITRGLTIASTDYLTDVTIIGEIAGNTNAMGIKLSNVIADGNFDLNFQDKEEGVIATTFTAHFDPANLEAKTDTEPWEILYPQDNP